MKRVVDVKGRVFASSGRVIIAEPNASSLGNVVEAQSLLQLWGATLCLGGSCPHSWVREAAAYRDFLNESHFPFFDPRMGVVGQEASVSSLDVATPPYPVGALNSSQGVGILTYKTNDDVGSSEVLSVSDQDASLNHMGTKDLPSALVNPAVVAAISAAPIRSTGWMTGGVFTAAPTVEEPGCWSIASVQGLELANFTLNPLRGGAFTSPTPVYASAADAGGNSSLPFFLGQPTSLSRLHQSYVQICDNCVDGFVRVYVGSHGLGAGVGLGELPTGNFAASVPAWAYGAGKSAEAVTVARGTSCGIAGFGATDAVEWQMVVADSIKSWNRAVGDHLEYVAGASISVPRSIVLGGVEMRCVGAQSSVMDRAAPVPGWPSLGRADGFAYVLVLDTRLLASQLGALSILDHVSMPAGSHLTLSRSPLTYPGQVFGETGFATVSDWTDRGLFLLRGGYSVRDDAGKRVKVQRLVPITERGPFKGKDATGTDRIDKTIKGVVDGGGPVLPFYDEVEAVHRGADVTDDELVILLNGGDPMDPKPADLRPVIDDGVVTPITGTDLVTDYDIQVLSDEAKTALEDAASRDSTNTSKVKPQYFLETLYQGVGSNPPWYVWLAILSVGASVVLNALGGTAAGSPAQPTTESEGARSGAATSQSDTPKSDTDEGSTLEERYER